jgi:glycine/D-amino acid oxidase-like deaminating enzyme
MIGGGLAGRSAAPELRQRGLDAAVVDAREIGAGARGRNGGQAIHKLAHAGEAARKHAPAHGRHLSPARIGENRRCLGRVRTPELVPGTAWYRLQDLP